MMKTRRTYTPIRIDMTPFVSIALLLIIFFVWVKMVQRPNVLSAWGDQGCRKGIEPEHSRRVFEIRLLDENTIQFCPASVGSASCASVVTEHRRTTRLREALFSHKKEALLPGELAIVIYPYKKSTVGCLANVLSELRRVGNLPYMLIY